MSLKKLVLFLFILLALPSLAQEDPGDVTASWMELNQPGEAHRKLDPFVGDWKTTTSIWMGGPKQAPLVFEGKAKCKWIYDGRFLEETTESVMQFPGEDGKMVNVPFKGRGTTGYDNFRKMYVNTWIDSMTTYISYNRGQFSADNKTFTLYGEMDEPAQGLVGRMLRIQAVLNSDDKHTFTMYDLHAGEDYKVMEIVYERL